MWAYESPSGGLRSVAQNHLHPKLVDMLFENSFVITTLWSPFRQQVCIVFQQASRTLCIRQGPWNQFVYPVVWDQTLQKQNREHKRTHIDLCSSDIWCSHKLMLVNRLLVTFLEGHQLARWKSLNMISWQDESYTSPASFPTLQASPNHGKSLVVSQSGVIPHESLQFLMISYRSPTYTKLTRPSPKPTRPM